MPQSGSHGQFYKTVGCIESRFDRHIDFVADHLTTAEDLSLLAFEIDIHEDGDQLFAESANVVNIGQTALESIRSDSFYGVDRSDSGSPQLCCRVACACGLGAELFAAECEGDGNAAAFAFLMQLCFVESQASCSMIHRRMRIQELDKKKRRTLIPGAFLRPASSSG